MITQLYQSAYLFVVGWILVLGVPTFILSAVSLNKFREHEFIIVRNPEGMKISLVVGAVLSFIVTPAGGYVFSYIPLHSTSAIPITVVILSISLNLGLVLVICRMVDAFNKVKRARMLHNHQNIYNVTFIHIQTCS